MEKWNGEISGIKYPYMDDAARWDYRIDENGTVYYLTANGEYEIWCPASRLYAHIYRLNQIAARR